jgi:UPF0271 protein
VSGDAQIPIYTEGVQLNLDAGELEDETEELWALFDVLNIACGGHAGDAASMARVIAFCAGRDRPRAGAHPSYPDRDGFGRRSIAIAADALEASVTDQCAALAAIARTQGLAIGSLKPHGALYHDAAARAELAEAVVCGATRALGNAIVVIGPPQGALREVAAHAGLRYAREGFADRRTRDDGSLVPRGEPGALVTDPDEAAERARRLVDVDTICIHADTPGALAIAHAVREALQ